MPAERQALLVIDASLDNRISAELRARGRAAVALSQLDLHRSLDDSLLPALVARYVDETFVLVTADDAMPADHASLIEELAVTVATIEPERDEGYDPGSWARDVAHRWAHAMAVQTPGTVERYSVTGHRKWTLRRSRRRRSRG